MEKEYIILKLYSHNKDFVSCRSYYTFLSLSCKQNKMRLTHWVIRIRNIGDILSNEESYQTRLILKNEISFKSVGHKSKILLISTFQKTVIAIPFQGKFEIP